MDAVAGVNLQTGVVCDRLSFIQWLVEALGVVEQATPVLHELNCGFVCQICGTTLRSVIHYCDLLARLSVPHCNGRGNWVKVSCDRVVVCLLLVIDELEPGWDPLKLSLLHLKAV